MILFVLKMHCEYCESVAGAAMIKYGNRQSEHLLPENCAVIDAASQAGFCTKGICLPYVTIIARDGF